MASDGHFFLLVIHKRSRKYWQYFTAKPGLRDCRSSSAKLIFFFDKMTEKRKKLITAYPVLFINALCVTL